MKLTGKQQAMPKKVADEASWWETIKIVVHALLIAMVVRLFLYQPFNIPSGSMKSTLLVGDYLFVSKLSYGYSRHSFFFGWPPFSGRVFESEPKRGDVVVFKLPRDNSTDYIKRLIGLPGDRIDVRAGILFLTGTEVPRRPLGKFTDIEDDGSKHDIDSYEETLPNGVKYTVLDITPQGDLDNFGPYVVPAGHYFMMGDNRDNSQDSRAIRAVGPVPYENLVGRADIIFFSTDPSCGYAPDRAWVLQKLVGTVCALTTGVRFRRFFKLVR